MVEVIKESHKIHFQKSVRTFLEDYSMQACSVSHKLLDQKEMRTDSKKTPLNCC